MTYEFDGVGGGAESPHLTIEFDGTRSRLSNAPGGIDPATETVTLRIDGRSYMSAVDTAFQVGDGLGGLTTVPGLEHVEWIDLTDGGGGAGALEAVTGAAGDPFELIGRFTDVRESGTERVDGVELRRFDATVSGADLLRSLSPEQQAEREAQAESAPRLAAIQDYRLAHMDITASFLVDDDGLLQRAEIESTVSGIEPAFEDCAMLSSPSMVREVYDYSAHGEPVAIAPPDPATVMTVERVEQLQAEAMGGGSTLAFLEEPQDLPDGVAEGCPG